MPLLLCFKALQFDLAGGNVLEVPSADGGFQFMPLLLCFKALQFDLGRGKFSAGSVSGRRVPDTEAS